MVEDLGVGGHHPAFFNHGNAIPSGLNYPRCTSFFTDISALTGLFFSAWFKPVRLIF
jgi:hypothetical protein